MRGCHSPVTGRITAPGSSWAAIDAHRAAEAAADLERGLDDGVALLPRCQGGGHINAILRANLEWSNPKIGRKLRDLNTAWQTGRTTSRSRSAARHRLPLGRLGDLVWGATQHNLT
jgi:hypothetical protein